MCVNAWLGHCGIVLPWTSLRANAVLYAHAGLMEQRLAQTGYTSPGSATSQAMTQIANPHWEHFPHEADMGVRGTGASREQAFEQAALALTAVIADLDKVAARESVEIGCEAPDDELLFVDWLNSLVYEMATRHMLFSRFAVQIEGHKLTAQAWGEPIDRTRHQPVVEVKGATYTGLRVVQAADGHWVAECIVDV